MSEHRLWQSGPLKKPAFTCDSIQVFLEHLGCAGLCLGLWARDPRMLQLPLTALPGEPGRGLDPFNMQMRTVLFSRRSSLARVLL